MTLDEWVGSVEGKVLDFDGLEQDAGECVQLVSFYLKDVLNVSVYFANAIDWYEKFESSPLVPNFTKHVLSDDYPKRGDVVIWGSGVGSQFGHIDICIADGSPGGFLGFDSNWEGDKTAHKVQHDYRFVLGYLRKKGDNMPSLAEGIIKTADDVAELTRFGFFREPTQDEINEMQGKYWIDAVRYFRLSGAGQAVKAQYEAGANPSDAQKKLDEVKKIVNG